ncbi:hypothetical protein, variant 1 [Cryptococcus amylolentus CBS 6039]|uniref:Uncharacterized protein n=1 Tax=Cryptococcus amylolentus CBS 6039 TaxID=1295533 RepID=A0A1E3I2Y1_9TREE|nr:hypothetical protein, variant 1 [Cryptococcus amylolentus CBS 6039]ODN82705.1 hypothetical protein, variant 1 [Cryptococcus amylolentus CBS 6039]
MLINQDSRLLGSYFGEVFSGLWSDPQDHEFDINEERAGRAPDLEFWKEIDKGWWSDGEFVVTTAHQQQHKLSAHNRSARHIKEGRDETSSAVMYRYKEYRSAWAAASIKQFAPEGRIRSLWFEEFIDEQESSIARTDLVKAFLCATQMSHFLTGLVMTLHERRSWGTLPLEMERELILRYYEMLYAIRELGPMLRTISHWERDHHKPRRWVPDATFAWAKPLDPSTVFYQECEHKWPMAIPSTFISVAKLVLKRHEEGIDKLWWDAWWIVRPDMRRYFRINFGVRYKYLPVQEEDIYLRMNYPDGRQVVESDTVYRNFPHLDPLHSWLCQELARNFYAQAYGRQPDSFQRVHKNPRLPQGNG